MWKKCLITFLANVIGVFIVKSLEAKFKAEKTWKIECTFSLSSKSKYDMLLELEDSGIPFYYTYANNHIALNDHLKECVVVSTYCKTRQQSKFVKILCDKYDGTYFISENIL